MYVVYHVVYGVYTFVGVVYEVFAAGIGVVYVVYYPCMACIMVRVVYEVFAGGDRGRVCRVSWHVSRVSRCRACRM